MEGNEIDGDLAAVDMPQVSYHPPAPDNTEPTVLVPVVASCTTPNATIRYTLDGSRPSEASPVLPVQGVKLRWPGPVVAFNVRAFLPGSMPSVTNGVVVERRRYVPRLDASAPLKSAFDGIDVDKATGVAYAAGWAVTPAVDGGRRPVTVSVVVQVDGAPPVTVTALADMPRPDLVPAGMAPDPNHGFRVAIPYRAPQLHALGPRSGPDPEVEAAAANVVVNVFTMVGVAGGAQILELYNSPRCLCVRTGCPCTPDTP